MLQNIRDKFTGTFALVILALLAIPFVFVGVGANYSFLTGSFAAKVDGEEISLGYFEARYRDIVTANPELATASSEERSAVRQQLLDSLVYEQLFENYLDDHGYRISDEQVVASIRDITEFQGENGEFDREAYNETLAAQGMSDAAFENSQRMGLRRQQLQLSMAATGLMTPAEYRRYINLALEERLVTTATFSEDSIAETIEISDADISTYYDENPDFFQQPESADVEYVMVSRSDVAAAVEVSEEELNAYYEENQFRYLQDEQRDASHILFAFEDDESAAEAEAAAVLERLRAGEDFAALAQEFSDDTGTAQEGGSFGALTRTQFPGELGAAIFALNEGDLDGPIRTDFGFHIVKLNRVLPQGSLPLDQVRAELINEIRDREADEAFRAAENDLGNALFDTPELAAAASAAGLEVQSATGITREGGGPFGSNQVAIDTIFEPGMLAGGQTSDLVELDNERVAVFRVTRYNEATRQPLDEVRDDIRSILTAAETDRLLNERAQALLADLNAGTEFRSAAEAAGAEVSEPLLLSRQDQETDPALLYSVYSAGRPTEMQPVRDVVRNSAGGYTVYSLDAVIAGRPESIPLAERDSTKLMRAQEAGTADFSAFLLALRDGAEVVINEDALAGNDVFQ
jgi:peptidyl-prolyl cis-trans isomerase D